MKIIFIGTGTGKISLNKFPTSLFFRVNDNGILVDTGESVYRALLSSGITSEDIDSIILTHFHADHLAGLAGLITQTKFEKRAKLLKIFLHKSLVEPLMTYLNTTYLFPELFEYELNIEGFEHDRKYNIGENISFIGRENRHVREKTGLIKPSIVPFISSGFLFDCCGKKVYYTSDVGSFQDLYLFEDHKIDYMITEAAHIKLSDILTAFKELNPGEVFITHFNEEENADFIKEYEALDNKTKTSIILSYDKFKIEI